jgi:hypothetical protein
MAGACVVSEYNELLTGNPSFGPLRTLWHILIFRCVCTVGRFGFLGTFGGWSLALSGVRPACLGTLRVFRAAVENLPLPCTSLDKLAVATWTRAFDADRVRTYTVAFRILLASPEPSGFAAPEDHL